MITKYAIQQTANVTIDGDNVKDHYMKDGSGNIYALTSNLQDVYLFKAVEHAEAAINRTIKIHKMKFKLEIVPVNISFPDHL